MGLCQLAYNHRSNPSHSIPPTSDPENVPKRIVMGCFSCVYKGLRDYRVVTTCLLCGRKPACWLLEEGSFASSYITGCASAANRRAEGATCLRRRTGFVGSYRARLPAATHRAAASALSSGRVLKAIAAPGAALRIALMTTSNNARLRGGRRTPPPMTTQS
jgi:hypothetical protein